MRGNPETLTNAAGVVVFEGTTSESGGSQTLEQVLDVGDTITGAQQIEGPNESYIQFNDGGDPDAGGGNAGIWGQLDSVDFVSPSNSNSVSASGGGGWQAYGASGAAGKPGGAASISGGQGNNGGDDPAQVNVNGGDGVGGKGRATVYTDGHGGVTGQGLVADGGGALVWGGVASGSGAPGNTAAFDGFLPLYVDTDTSDLYLLVGSTITGPYNLGT